MNTGSLIALDLLVSVAAAAGWLGAGASAAVRRGRIAAGLAAAALLATLARAATVVGLAGAGWWFVQEKVTLTLPLLAVAVLAATILAGPRLVRAARTPGPGPQRNRGTEAPDLADGGVAGAVAAPQVVAALLTAGYAAAAGPVVTFLIGYPATWSVALVTVALVALAALVTRRAVAPAGPAQRRIAAVALGIGALGAGLVFVPSEEVDTGGGRPDPAGTEVAVDTLRGPDTPAPGGEVRRFELTAEQATVALSSGRHVDAWTFNGQLPGPAITATEGDLIEVTLRNADIPGGVTAHWHGYDVPAGEDGVPGLTQAAVRPGEEFRYRFRADQVGTFWYHTHQVSHIGVRKGLYGMLVVTPRGPTPDRLDLTVPVHTFDGVTVFGDSDQSAEHRVAPGTPVRLRLANTDSTPLRLTLAGTPFRVVAVDGDDLYEPPEVGEVTLRLAAGGRYDLAFTMPDRPVGLLAGGATFGQWLLPDGFTGQPGAPDTSGWPELDLLHYGSPADTPFGPDSEFDRDFELVLDRGIAMVDGVPGYAQTVNGRAYPSVPTQLVGADELVRFTVVNRSLETHPWHLHGHRVLVLSRDGERPTGAPLWLDTFDVRPGEVWQVGFRTGNPGLWMNHCHNLPHAEQGMMLHLAYEGVTSQHHDH